MPLSLRFSNSTLPHRPLRLLAGAAVAATIAVLVALVLIAILTAAGDAAAQPPRVDVLHLVWMTTVQASLTTVLSLLVGTALAWALNRLRFPGRDVVVGLFGFGHRDARADRRLRPAQRVGPGRLGERGVAGADRPSARGADLRARRHSRRARDPRCLVRGAHIAGTARCHSGAAAEDRAEPGAAGLRAVPGDRLASDPHVAAGAGGDHLPAGLHQFSHRAAAGRRAGQPDAGGRDLLRRCGSISI